MNWWSRWLFTGNRDTNLPLFCFICCNVLYDLTTYTVPLIKAMIALYFTSFRLGMCLWNFINAPSFLIPVTSIMSSLGICLRNEMNLFSLPPSSLTNPPILFRNPFCPLLKKARCLSPFLAGCFLFLLLCCTCTWICICTCTWILGSFWALFSAFFFAATFLISFFLMGSLIFRILAMFFCIWLTALYFYM